MEDVAVEHNLVWGMEVDRPGGKTIAIRKRKKRHRQQEYDMI